MARGGKRVGAGRKVGSPIKKTREVAIRAMAEGKTPLEVMLDNMRHFQQVALDAEAVLDGLSAEEIIGGGLMTPEEQFKLLLAKAKQAAGLREKAHECARDAAPFMHARLANVQMEVGQPGDFDGLDADELRKRLIREATELGARDIAASLSGRAGEAGRKPH